MIFNRDKKANSNNSDSLEDSAIDRWKSLNKSGEPNEPKEQDDEARQGFFKRNSYLNSLMKDHPDSTSKKENSEMLQAIALTNEINHLPSQTESIIDDKEIVDNFEEQLELDSFHLQNFDEKEPLISTIQIIETKPKSTAVVTTVNAAEKVIPKTPPADFSLNSEDDLKARFGANLRSALGEGTMIDGTFSFETPVKVDGCLTGEIKSPSALIVGKNARVNARIKVGSLIIIGSVEGEVEAQDLVEIRASGSLSGDVITKRIALEEGGLFNGTCTILD